MTELIIICETSRPTHPTVKFDRLINTALGTLAPFTTAAQFSIHTVPIITSL
jgi:hypothetical protein